MAQKSTIYKVNLTVNDFEENRYHSFDLVIARHPSETPQRLCARLLAFTHQADEELMFTRGLCVEEEPEIWRKNDNGDIESWIEMGQPSLKRVRQACAKANHVAIYTYEDRTTQNWWSKAQKDLARFDNIAVYNWAPNAIKPISDLLKRTMEISVTREGETLQIAIEGHYLEIEASILKGRHLS